MPNMTTRHLSRREFLHLTAGGAGVTALLSARWAQAMGTKPEFQGVHRLSGQVFINHLPAKLRMPVHPGDTIRTGPDGTVIFVVGVDAYLMRENSTLTVEGEPALIQRLTLKAGKLLSVFAPNKAERRFLTTTTVIGIRGTGLYIEAEKDKTFVCTCYGTTQLAVADKPDTSETITTKHHEAPRYIYPASSGRKKLIVKAKVINHTDDELTMLEWLVGRQPPFGSSGSSY
ncbi:MAG: hypothetical protein AABZ50_08220 [Pseudomonadota bacterium]